MRELNVIWIDDDADVIAPLVGLLEESAYRVTRLLSVMDAKERLGDIRDCDLLLLDAILPTGTERTSPNEFAGLELLKELREEHDVQVPALVLSVVDSNKIAAQLNTLSVAGYLRKPAFQSELLAAVDSILREATKSGAEPSPAPEEL